MNPSRFLSAVPLFYCSALLFHCSIVLLFHCSVVRRALRVPIALSVEHNAFGITLRTTPGTIPVIASPKPATPLAQGGAFPEMGILYNFQALIEDHQKASDRDKEVTARY